MNVEEFRNLMAEQLKIDRKVTRHEMSGPSIDVILKQASTELNVPITKLDYEIMVRGNQGLLRMIRPRDYTILVYRSEIDRSGESTRLDPQFTARSELFAPVDGQFFLRVRPDGVYLKLQPPIHEGNPVSEQSVFLAVTDLMGENVDKRLIRELCDHQICPYTKIASIKHDPMSDARVNIQVDLDNMRAFAILTKPEACGAHLQIDTLIDALQHHGVVYGYDEQKLDEFLDNPTYNKPVLVAEGRMPSRGKDLYLEIFTENHMENTEDKEEGGRINYKEQGSTKTAYKGAIIGKLHPATDGEVGHNVVGAQLATEPGEQKEYTIGSGVHLDPETNDLIADLTGEIVFDEENMAVSIHEVCVVEGNLTNNVDFPGSILIKGDIENDYVVKAKHNITIEAHLGRSQIDCGGTLIIAAGINGVDASNNLLVHSKGPVFARYINNAGVISESDVIVDDGILNALVVSDGYIVCRGKRAVINAAEVNATRGIYAKALGSSSGTATTIIAGLPTKLKEKKKELEEKRQHYLDMALEMKHNLVSQHKQKEIFSQSNSSVEAADGITEKIELAEKQLQQMRNITRKMDEKIKKLQTEIQDYSKNAFISTEKSLYPGVELIIGDLQMNVNSPYTKGITFRKNFRRDGEPEIKPNPLEPFDLEQFKQE